MWAGIKKRIGSKLQRRKENQVERIKANAIGEPEVSILRVALILSGGAERGPAANPEAPPAGVADAGSVEGTYIYNLHLSYLSLQAHKQSHIHPCTHIHALPYINAPGSAYATTPRPTQTHPEVVRWEANPKGPRPKLSLGPQKVRGSHTPSGISHTFKLQLPNQPGSGAGAESKSRRAFWRVCVCGICVPTNTHNSQPPVLGGCCGCCVCWGGFVVGGVNLTSETTFLYGFNNKSTEQEAESQWIVGQSLLSHLQYPVPYQSRLQRIYLSQ